jgi:hypothetical protein
MMDGEDFTAEGLLWGWRVLETLRGLRLGPVQYEAELCGAIAGALEGARIPFEREVSLGGWRRIDFLCADGVGIEVKKGSPNAAALVAQARRYCTSERVVVLVLVVERNVIRASELIKGTPVFYVGLNANWGVAV